MNTKSVRILIFFHDRFSLNITYYRVFTSVSVTPMTLKARDFGAF